MEHRGGGIVEWRNREIQHPEAQLLVRHNLLVCRSRFNLGLALCHEGFVGQIAKVDRQNIGHNKQCHCRQSPLAPPLSEEQRTQQNSCRQEDKEHRACGIGRENLASLRCHSLGSHIAEFGVHTLREVLLATLHSSEHILELLGHHCATLLTAKVEQRRACNCKDEAEACCDTRRNSDSTRYHLALAPTLAHLPESQTGQERCTPLHHDKCGGYSAELIVEREIVEAEFGEPHCVVAPRQHNGKNSSRYNPPAVTILGQENTQQSEEDNDCTEIGRACGVGLLAPIGWQLLCQATIDAYLLEALCHLSILGKGVTRVASHKVGDEHIPTLIDAIAPRRSVVDIQTFALTLGNQGATASCGVVGVLKGVV